MKEELTLKKPEHLVEAVRRHPAAATVGGVVTALIFGGIAAAAATPVVTVLMALMGLVVGAPGAAFMADSAKST